MEAIVFVTVVFYGIEQQLNRRMTDSDIRSFIGRVRVYGDDIIVPVEYVQSVMQALETFGFRVNKSKSFWNGKFRESCGRDYYDGQDISLVRLRRLLPANRRHVREVVSAVSLRNQLFGAGWYRTAAWLDEVIGRIIPFPYVEPTSPLLGRHGTLKEILEQDLRHDEYLHRPLVKGVRISPLTPVSKLDDYGALMKWFLSIDPPNKRAPCLLPWWEAEMSPLAEDHLERAGRASSVRIKTGWGPLR